jgi:cytochrome c553
MERRLAAALLGAAACTAAAPALAQGGPYAERFAATCAPCHGAQGASSQPTTPSLGGQPSVYAITQLFLFREGRRNDHPLAPAMAAVAKGMSNDDLRGYSDFIATLPPPPAPDAAAADPARLQRGRTLAEKHHCLACHGPDLSGGRNVPRVAHQREDYLLIALRGFRSGVRAGYTNAMGEALAGLQPQDIEDLGHYLAHQPR